MEYLSGKVRAVILVVVLGLCAAPVFAQDSSGVSVFDKYSDAVITVRLVVKVRMVIEGREMDKSEDVTEAVATVIDPSGLAVLSFCVAEPAHLAGRFFRGEKIKMESEVVDVKMLLPDGGELPARLVLRDKDLDLVFVRPAEKPAKPFSAVDLSLNSPAGILDEFLILSRLGKVAGRVPAVSVGRIEAVVKKPRTFYVPDESALAGKLGAPAFLPDGKIIGLLLLKMVPGTSGGMRMSMASMTSMMFGGASAMGLMPVILPAKDILEVSRQVPEQE